MDGLDFWVGSWRCTWDDGHGSNTISRALDDRVILERFEAVAPEPFSGMSVSVLGADNVWRQTWVDSTGNYWHFEGGPQPDGTFVFATPGRVDDDRRFKRMVFSDISPDGLSWRWEHSDDAETWSERWAISYQRA
jgi:hypothetical protein